MRNRNLLPFLRQDSIRRTFGYYLMFICIGLGIGATGPTIPALAEQTGSTLGAISSIFLASSIGYTLGTVLGGRLLDRLRGHPVLGTAHILAGLLAFCIPLAPWFWLLILVAGLKGLADGLINTGGNTLLVWTHREKAAPYMNALHFFFGLGAFLAPLLAAQLTGYSGGYRWVYWTLAILNGLVGLRLLLLKNSPPPVTHQSEARGIGGRAPVPYLLVMAAMLFLFFYVGAEITFGGWVYTYAMTLGLANAAGAAYMNSAFWLALTVGRLISIPAAIRFPPQRIIPAALAGCLVVLTLLLAFPAAGGVLWIAAIGLGFCMAPVYPSGFTLASQSLQLTARLSSIMLLGDSFGAMLMPWLVGLAIERTSAQAMVWLVLASLVMNLVAFAGIIRLRPAPP
jgi:FHS family Na+ dependent glucose MFS transporter 1